MGSRPSSFSLSSPGPLRLYSTPELLKLPPPTWLVDRVLPAGGVCGLYGKPETLKSFIAIDLAMSIATGRDWHGIKVQGGPVLYVAAEGGAGISKRVHAWLSYHNVKSSSAEVAWLIESLMVNTDGSDMDTLIDRLEEIEQGPTFIVVDTLARCLEGDENQQEDMGRFIAGLDKLRHDYGSTLLAIHHTNVSGERERGNTAFRGATETMIEVTRTGDEMTFTCNKQKDAEHFPAMTFEIEPVPNYDSVVLRRTDDVRELQKDEKTQEMLECLKALQPCSFDDWFSSVRMSRSTFFHYFTELKKEAVIIKANRLWSISSSGGK